MSASDAPQRPAGVRARSGNAMLRTRAALLEAAATCVEQVGVRRTTMAGVAATAGVAKATLYNHFRTKDDLLAALLEDRVAALGAACAGVTTDRALEQAAAFLADWPPLRTVARREPEVLLPLLTPGQGRGWQQAREQLAAVLPGASPEQRELVLRWLVGQLMWPASPADAAAVARGLAPAGASAAPGAGRLAGDVHGHLVGLGWPAT